MFFLNLFELIKKIRGELRRGNCPTVGIVQGELSGQKYFPGRIVQGKLSRGNCPISIMYHIQCFSDRRFVHRVLQFRLMSSLDSHIFSSKKLLSLSYIENVSYSKNVSDNFGPKNSLPNS